LELIIYAYKLNKGKVMNASVEMSEDDSNKEINQAEKGIGINTPEYREAIQNAMHAANQRTERVAAAATFLTKHNATIAAQDAHDDTLPFHLQHAITSVDLNLVSNFPTITATNNTPVTYNGDIYSTQQKLENELADLLYRAKRKGYVITVDLKSLTPLAAGNFVMVPHVRLARGNY